MGLRRILPWSLLAVMLLFIFWARSIASPLAGSPPDSGIGGALEDRSPQADLGRPYGVAPKTPLPKSEDRPLSSPSELPSGAAGISKGQLLESEGPSTPGISPVPETPSLAPFITELQALGGPERPLRLKIPAIEVDAGVEALGLTAERAMATPSEWSVTGWFEPGYVPGQPGNAVINGHLDAPGKKPAVFSRLDELEPGDQIMLQMDSGALYTFVVDKKQSFTAGDAPIEEIFGWSDDPGLNLITCQGDWNKRERNYEERLVVYTRLLSRSLVGSDAAASRGRGLISPGPDFTN